jgi:hypothetical protein
MVTPLLEPPLRPIARPDLALTLADLPASYTQAAPDYAVDSPLRLSVLRRTDAAPGPVMIWSAAFDAGTLGQAAVAVHRPQEIAALLSPSMAPRLSDWDAIEAVESPERHAHAYRFRYRGADAEGATTGILYLSQHDTLVTSLTLFGPAHQSQSMLPALAQPAEARLAAAQRREAN